jgi:hypothetical protein
VSKDWEKELLDRVLSDRDFTYLAGRIRRADELSPEAREQLATVIHGLLTGKIKRPKHRPKKQSTEWEAQQIARDVIHLHRYRPEWSKLSAAVKKVAKDRDCAESKVWAALKDHRIGAVVRLEELEYDAMWEAAYEARWKAAVDSLKEEHGDREFSDEEVEAAAQELDEAGADYGDDPRAS